MGRCYIIFGRMPTLLPTSLTQRALPKSVQILWNKSFGIWHCWQQSEVRRSFHGLVFTKQWVIHYKALKTVESIDTGQTCWNVRLCYTLEICTLSFGLSLPRTFNPKTKTWVKSQTRPMTYPPIFHTHTVHISYGHSHDSSDAHPLHFLNASICTTDSVVHNCIPYMPLRSQYIVFVLPLVWMGWSTLRRNVKSESQRKVFTCGSQMYWHISRHCLVGSLICSQWKA